MARCPHSRSASSRGFRRSLAASDDGDEDEEEGDEDEVEEEEDEHLPPLSARVRRTPLTQTVFRLAESDNESRSRRPEGMSRRGRHTSSFEPSTIAVVLRFLSLSLLLPLLTIRDKECFVFALLAL